METEKTGKTSKNSTRKKDFYQSLISQLKISTNLQIIQEKFKISKQQLNYYLRKLLKKGIIEKKGVGWYEVVKTSKNSTVYGNDLVEDLTRGHAFIWKAKISKKPENWDNRIKILEKSNINFKLVGAMNNIPRIKVYGRKVWLCNDHIKIWETKSKSYYSENAKDSKKQAYDEILIVFKALENKLGINLRPYLINLSRSHYALIKNQLAKHHNKNGEILRVNDKDGEWLLIDDSLEQGGELEVIGKNSTSNHDKMKGWWNDHKQNNFDVTPTFLLESLGKIIKVQQMHSDNIVKHHQVLDEMSQTLKEIRDSLKK